MSSSELETFKLKQKLAGLDSYSFRGTHIIRVHKDAINNQGVIKIPEGVSYIASDAFNAVGSLENFK